MRIVVIGPGALGSLLAALLKRPSGQELWLLDHNRGRAFSLAEGGLILEEAGQRRQCLVRATADPEEIGPVDLVFLCVKSFAVRAALFGSGPVFGTGTLLVALENGVGHLEILTQWGASRPWALGVTTLGATLVRPGHVRHGGKGRTRVGFVGPAPDLAKGRLAQAATLLNESGLATETVDNILDYVWEKLLVNVGINALTAIHDCPNGELLCIPQAREQLARAVREAATVARAKGVSVAADPVAATVAVCRATAANISSMLQDVRRKRPTEIDAINGAVVRAARQLGIPVPLNEELVRAVKGMERRYG